MKTSKLIAMTAAIAGAAFFYSCDNNDSPAQDGRTPVNFSAEIGEVTVAESRAVNDQWTANDEIGVFMVENGTETIYDGVENKSYTTAAGNTATTNFAPTDGNAVYFPMDGTPLDFIAYHPWQAGTTLSTEIDIELDNQTTRHTFDLLWVKADNAGAGYSKTTNKTLPVSLTFDHKLTKIALYCKSGIGVTDADLTTGMVATITGMPTKNTFNLTTGQLGTATDVANITAANLGAASGNIPVWFEAIILPNGTTNNDGDRSVEFLLGNGETFLWKIPAATDFLPGYEYTYSVTFNRTGVSVQGTINKWQKGNGNSGQGVVAE